MDLEQKRILSENFEYFAKNVNVGRVEIKTRELYPKVISDADVLSLNVRKNDARVGYLLDLFKKEKDGYTKLYDVLKQTNHENTLLKIMERVLPGTQQPPTPSAKKASTQNPKDGNEALLSAMQDLMARQTFEMKKELRNITREEMTKQLAEFKTSMQKELDILKERMERLANLEKAISAGKQAQDEIKIVVQSLTDEFFRFKDEYKIMMEKVNQLEKTKTEDAENFQKFMDRLKLLGSLGNDEMWKEIDKLRQELEAVRKWAEENCGSMIKRLESVEKGQKGIVTPATRARSDVISESDIQYIAIKVATYWEVIAKDVGIQGKSIKGGQVKEDQTTAAARFISLWLAESGSSSKAPPTWGSLYEIMKRHDAKVAEEIDNLRQITEK